VIAAPPSCRGPRGCADPARQEYKPDVSPEGRNPAPGRRSAGPP
jgi:hypothetical protein